MEYCIISIAEARAHGIEILPTQRQSNDKTKAVIHANKIAAVDVFNQLKRYQYDDPEFIELLNSPEWTPEEGAEVPSEDYGKVLALQILNTETTDEINTMDLTNKESIEVKEFFPHWEDYIGKSLNEVGFKVLYKDNLYEILQPVPTVLEGQTPDIVPANYGLVSEHEGTKEDPIPYVHWLVIRKDKYYTENGILYIGLQDAPNGYDADLSTLSTLAQKVE